MGKLGGIALIAALALTGCAAQSAPEAAPASPTSAAQAQASQRIAPLLAAPAPADSVAPEFNDQDAQAKYLDGLKKVWRGDVPSDDVLLKAGGASCTLFSEGKNYNEIASLAGTAEVDVDNAASAAIYAGRNLCTQFNPDR